MSLANTLLKASVVSSVLLLSGCGTYLYKPAVYPLAQDRIADFDVNGKVVLENVQTSTELRESSNSGVTHTYNYQEVTEGFNQQFYRELGLHGKSVSDAGNKTLKTSITHLICETRGLNTWVYRCEVKGQVETADGLTVAIDYEHGAPVVAGIEPALNGMLAIAVEKTLENQDMLNYLKK